MKITLSRAFVPVLVFGFVTVGAVWAHGADSTNGAAGAPPASLLDNDEMVQLKNAREQVLTAHPELKAEEEKLKTLHETFTQQNPPPTADQRNAAFAEWKDYQKSMRAEMLKIDPTLKPLFAKLDASRKQRCACSLLALRDKGCFAHLPVTSYALAMPRSRTRTTHAHVP